MVLLREEPLRKLCVAIFNAAQTSDDEARIVSNILVDTSLRGIDSHGVRMIPRYITGIQKGTLIPGSPIKVLVDTPTTAMWDAGQGFGFVAGSKAMQTAIEKAREYKIGSVGTRGGGHTGALYWYSYQATKNNMIGVTLCRSSGRSVAPYGGVDGELGINVLAIAIPAGKYNPIVLDMAATAISMGHLEVMAVRGQKTPEGWLIKPDGTWSNEPQDFLPPKREAKLVGVGHPYSEYKGYGLDFIIEALAGGISWGCGFEAKGNGHLFMAIDPTGYCSLNEFTGKIEAMIDHLKASRKRPSFSEILYPGERSAREEERRRERGIFVDDPWWENIIRTANELKVDVAGIMENGFITS